MRPDALAATAADLLDRFVNRPQPLGGLITGWARANRFAGSGDRRRLGNLLFAIVRDLEACFALCREDRPGGRDLLLAALARDALPADFADAAVLFSGGPHGLAPLSDEEHATLAIWRTEAVEGPAAVNVPDHLWVDVSTQMTSAGLDAGAEASALTGPAPLDLRVNTLKASLEPVLAALRAECIDAQSLDWVPGALRIGEGESGRAPRLVDHPLYTEGSFEVQDAGAQAASLSVGARPGEQIVDLCAGAGGKTLALAAAMHNRGQIHAFDIDPGKLQVLRERAARAGVHCVQAHRLDDAWAAQDGTPDVLQVLTRRMDRVVVDAPCSGSGTWRREPHLRWMWSRDALERIRASQARLLARAADLVKPGGWLVYITCSVLRSENDAQIQSFLQAEGGNFAPDCPDAQSGGAAGPGPGAEEQNRPGATNVTDWAARSEYGWVMTPGRHGTDGFYISLLRRLA
ncbi:MAG: RsmB/NOP family class I SAM-dependent RNA methyltransferase [Pseudomonadota bacterium]